ncbi:hypothetical protein ACFV4P_15925, partial [Kitasatospora sp. NPDC059795]|uniref:hypothetical protein n=1 Tax=Kitasatospora sp. NPDC059795 TaxID=3346949 RepID=UPI00365F4898
MKPMAAPIDTGQIVNQGHALHLFRGLAATDGEPDDPVGGTRLRPGWPLHHPRPDLADHPAAWTDSRLPLAVTGRKDSPTVQPTVLIEEIDPCHLAAVMRTGCRLRRFTLTGVEIEHTSPRPTRAPPTASPGPSTELELVMSVDSWWRRQGPRRRLLPARVQDDG